MPLKGKGKIESTISVLTQVTGDLENSTSLLSILSAYVFSNGSGNNQATLIWSDERTVGAFGSDLIDFSTIENVAGEATNFSNIKMLYVENRNATASNVIEIKLSAATPAIIIRGGFLAGTNPGGSVMLVAPDASGYDAAGGLLVTNNSGSSIIYRVSILGI